MDSFFIIVKNFISSFKRGLATVFGKIPFLDINKEKDFDQGRQQIELDKKLVFSLSKSRIPNWKQLRYLKTFLNKRELWLIRGSVIVIAVCLIFVGSKFYKEHLQVVPAKGGKYIEALVGSPVHINPLYANANDVDSDINALIYSSLFKRGKTGELVNDLVESYEVSTDGKSYTLKIKEGVKWHAGNSLISGSELNADDVVFTFGIIKNKQYNSTLRSSFNGVEIEKLDDRTIKFVLSDPYAAFLDFLTFGILPANLWSEITPETFELTKYQKKPIGSGPYQFLNYVVDKAGNIKEYNLAINEDYYGQKPYVEITFKFYPSFEEAISALNDNQVDGISYLPPEYKENVITPKADNFNKLILPQLTAIFFNKDNTPALADKNIRQALAYGIDKNTIVNEVLAGDASVVEGPILSSSFAYNQNIKKYEFNLAKADEILNKAEWKVVEVTEEQAQNANKDLESGDEAKIKQAEKIAAVGVGKWRQKNNEFLIIKLDTVDRNENRVVAEAVQKYWESLGVKVQLEILPASQIKSEVIKNRNFGALFYGQALGSDPDPYAFWHSSQSGADGFNIANFSNKEVDQLLEDARLTSDIAKRQELYKKFQDIIAEEEPAIFMYSPVYTYLQSTKLKGFDVKQISSPSDRLANVTEWYLQTAKKLIW